MRWWLLAAFCAGCGGGINANLDAGPGGGAGGDAVVGGPFVITTPMPNAVISSNYLRADGRWVAEVTYKTQGGTGVDTVEWVNDGVVVGIGAAPDYIFITQYTTTGDVTVEAVARDVAGAEVGRASVTVTIEGTSATGCASSLDALGVPWMSGPTTEGILSALTVTLPMNGVTFTDVGQMMMLPRATWLMDCNLAVALWRTTDILRNYSITEIIDSGIYRYVCADSSMQPPACGASGLSIHSAGLAVDIIGFKTSDGTLYTVDDDWITDTLAAGENTCSVLPKPGVNNEILHSLYCEIAAAGIFKIHLSPNYDGRNHWHFDLSPDVMVVVR